MVIITRNPDYQAEGCVIAHSLREALSLAEQAGESEAFVIGGGQIFAQALPLADQDLPDAGAHCIRGGRVLSIIDLEDWSIQATSEVPADDKNQFSSTYMVLLKRP